MSSELILDWAGHQGAVDQLLSGATGPLLILEKDCSRLNLESAARHAWLETHLRRAPHDSCRLIVGDSEQFQRTHPRTMALIARFGHVLAAQQIPESLQHLRDSMLLVGDGNGLIRFDTEQARSKLVLDEPEEIKPYLRRFQEIWAECHTPISATTLGL